MAITSEAAKPMISGHFTVNNGFILNFSGQRAIGPIRPLRGSCVAATWKNRGLTPIIQRCQTRHRSPCINICTLDEHGYCHGCYRTIQEIANWSLMTSTEQRALLLDLERRAGRRAPRETHNTSGDMMTMDAIERIKTQLSAAPVVLYMKGTPDFPQCGFSAQTVGALRALQGASSRT